MEDIIEHTDDEIEDGHDEDNVGYSSDSDADEEEDDEEDELGDYIPPAESDAQEARIRMVWQTLKPGATQQNYQEGVSSYEKYWGERGEAKPTVTPEGVSIFLRHFRNSKSVDTLNKWIKGLQFKIRAYPRPLEAQEPDLRGVDLIKTLIQVAKKRKLAQDRRGNAGSGKPHDKGWTEQQCVALNQYWLQRASMDWKRQKGDPLPCMALQMRSDFLFLNACLGSDRDARDRQLADLFSYDIAILGPDKAVVAATVLRNGKTNQKGRAEFLGTLRNVDPLVCPQGAQAMHFFCRFEINKEPPPDFSTRASWYRTPVSPGRVTKKKGVRAVHHNTQCRLLRKAMDDLGMEAQKVVYAARGNGVLAAAAGGSSPEDITMLEHWNHDQFDTSYLTALPIKALLGKAGFPRDFVENRPYSSSFHLPRSRVEVPAQLCDEIFKWIDEWLPRIRKRNLDGSAATVDAAATSFLEYMVHLRTVFFQDAALLHDKFPTLVIFKHKVFKNPAWETFKLRVLEVQAVASQAYSPPKEVASALLSMEERMVAMLQQSDHLRRAKQAQSEQRMVAILDKFEQRLMAIADQFEQKILNALANGLGTSRPLSEDGRAPPHVHATTGAGPSGATQAAPNGMRPHSTEPELATNEPSGQHSFVSRGPLEEEVHDECGNSNPHAMDEDPKTVADVWNEYAKSVHGRLPIKVRNTMIPNWRSLGKVKRRHYYNQKLIWGAIELVAQAEQIDPDDAMALFQTKQARNRWSLRATRKWIEKVRRENKEEKSNLFVPALINELKQLVD